MIGARSLAGMEAMKRLAMANLEYNRRMKLQADRRAAIARANADRLGPQFGEHTSLLTLEGSPYTDLLLPKRYKDYKGGRGAARSWTFAEALIRRSTHENIRVLCTREYQNSIEDSVHKVLGDTISRLNLNNWFNVTGNSIKSRAGAEFMFKGLHNNVKEIKSTEGVDVLWIEEGQTTSKESIEVIDPTIRKAGSEVWISRNPENDSDPMEIFIEGLLKNQPDDIIQHHVNFDSNPYFPQELEKIRLRYLRAIANAESDDEREQAQSDYDHVWLGQTRKINNEIILSGKCVLEEFDDLLWKKAQRVLYGADWGFARDPNTLHRYFILDDCLYVEYEAYGTGIDLEGNKDQDGYGELEQLWNKVPGVKEWPIKADAARPETISFMRGKGYSVSGAEKWPGSVEDGIAHLRSFRKIIVHPRCKKWWWESRNYKYKKDRVTGEILPIIIDKNNHCIDDARYALDGYIQRRGDGGIWARLGMASLPE